VSINIKSFIADIAAGDFQDAAKTIYRDSALPAVCGRVCPQEIQCEGKCILGKKHEPVAIGKLERFVGDWSRENEIKFDSTLPKNNYKIAVVGSGPAGITCAKELLLLGYNVTIFEALHKYGGVLVYGIPSFRLPKHVVKYEVEQLEKLGAHFEKNVIIGKTLTMEQLLTDEGFEAVFIGTGAGLPNFMNIPGENLNGVVSANEFLTRNNLLLAYKKEYQTPNYVGKRVAVVGGGNVAMDAARTALRLGAHVEIVYRRSASELPARHEEVVHAQKEGVIFNLLVNPIEIVGDEKGWVKMVKCERMELGEPDATGRRKPVPIANSEFTLEIDMLIVAIGTKPNPLVGNTTKGVELNEKNGIIIDEATGRTTREAIYAGGDAVSGSATVILAMGAGKKAAKAIDVYVKEKYEK
jgi:glutamate synthase (NADPH/NADH) small chain